MNMLSPSLKRNLKLLFSSRVVHLAHKANSVRNLLNEKLPGKRIGRRGPIEWPAQSPDLTLLDFFFWGVIKDKVYGENYRNPVSRLQSLERCPSSMGTQIYSNECAHQWQIESKNALRSTIDILRKIAEFLCFWNFVLTCLLYIACYTSKGMKTALRITLNQSFKVLRNKKKTV